METSKETLRPKTLYGMTFEMGNGCGKMHVTVNHTKAGEIREVFARLGKHGGCMMANTDMAGRLISLALRSGVPADKIIKHLHGINCGSSGNGILSCPSCISSAVEQARDILKEESK